MKIKFCGIRRLEDVAFCNELQPEYLGMILSSGFRPDRFRRKRQNSW